MLSFFTLLVINIGAFAQHDSAKAINYDRSITMADMAFSGNDYLTAKRFYKLALKAKPNEKYPQEHIDICDKKMASDSWMATNLNCPCNKGKITQLKNFTDIYVITSDDSTVHAALAGNVASVVKDSNSHTYTIIIKHGKYIATYSVLTSATVKQGDDVKESQAIGQMKKQGSSYAFNFSLLHGKEKEDAMNNVHCK